MKIAKSENLISQKNYVVWKTTLKELTDENLRVKIIPYFTSSQLIQSYRAVSQSPIPTKVIFINFCLGFEGL